MIFNINLAPQYHFDVDMNRSVDPKKWILT